MGRKEKEYAFYFTAAQLYALKNALAYSDDENAEAVLDEIDYVIEVNEL